MALYIRNEEVNALAEKVKETIGARNKTEAVRTALQFQLEAEQKKKPLLEQMKEIQAKVKKLGDLDPNFDMKEFSDEMWEID